MRSDNLDAAVEARSSAGVLYRLLDPAFGLFIWGVHFLAIYAATSVACVLGLGVADAGARSSFITALVVVTAVAAAIVALHALLTYRRREEVLDRRFLIGITIGHDAIAVIGILYQLFPILMVPLCQ